MLTVMSKLNPNPVFYPYDLAAVPATQRELRHWAERLHRVADLLLTLGHRHAAYVVRRQANSITVRHG